MVADPVGAHPVSFFDGFHISRKAIVGIRVLNVVVSIGDPACVVSLLNLRKSLEICGSIEVGPSVPRSRVMKVDEDIKPILAFQLKDSGLCRGNFGVVGIFIPVAIVIARDSILPACSDCDAVNIHNWDEMEIGHFTKLDCGWIIAHSP